MAKRVSFQHEWRDAGERYREPSEREDSASISEKIEFFILAFCAGLKDAMSFNLIIHFFSKSKAVRVCTLKCVVLNGLIFLGSIFLFRQAILPLINLLGSLLQTRSNEEKHDVAVLIKWTVYLIYQSFWIYPIYCISFILNTIWYQEIADQAYAIQHGKPASTNVKDMIRDEVYRMLLVASLLFQLFLLHLIPVFGPAISFVYLRSGLERFDYWLYSLYAFEYTWTAHGWSLDKRLSYLENNWAFFAGFGSPCTLATFFSEKFVSVGVYAVLFPLLLLLAIRSEPPKIARASAYKGSKFPIFRYPKWMTNKLLTLLGSTNGLNKKIKLTKELQQRQQSRRPYQ